jgi:putative transposase
VHSLRNVLANVPKGSAEMVAAAIRTIFAQPQADMVREQLDVIAGRLGRQFPKVEAMLREAAPGHPRLRRLPDHPLEEDLVHQPVGTARQRDQTTHRRRRCLPNPDVLLRLAGAVLLEAHHEWQVSDHHYLSEASMALLNKHPEEVVTAQLVPA